MLNRLILWPTEQKNEKKRPKFGTRPMRPDQTKIWDQTNEIRPDQTKIWDQRNEIRPDQAMF